MFKEATRRAHYTRIAGRICESLDRLQVPYNRREVPECLTNYYEWLHILDQEMEEMVAGKARQPSVLLEQTLLLIMGSPDPGLSPTLGTATGKVAPYISSSQKKLLIELQHLFEQPFKNHRQRA